MGCVTSFLLQACLSGLWSRSVARVLPCRVAMMGQAAKTNSDTQRFYGCCARSCESCAARWHAKSTRQKGKEATPGGDSMTRPPPRRAYRKTRIKKRMQQHGATPVARWGSTGALWELAGSRLRRSGGSLGVDWGALTGGQLWRFGCSLGLDWGALGARWGALHLVSGTPETSRFGPLN